MRFNIRDLTEKDWIECLKHYKSSYPDDVLYVDTGDRGSPKSPPPPPPPPKEEAISESKLDRIARKKILNILLDNKTRREGSPCDYGVINQKKLPFYKLRDRIFHRKDKHTKKGYAVCLVVDVSGSMSGNEIRQEAKMACQFITDFKDIVDLSVVTYNREIKKEDYSDLKELTKRMIYATECSRNRGCNHDAGAIIEARKILMKSQAKRKIMIVLSDGLPSCESSSCYEYREYLYRMGGDGAATKTEAVKALSMGIATIGIGVGSTAVSYYYRHHSTVNDASQAYSALLPLLKKQIRRTH